MKTRRPRVKIQPILPNANSRLKNGNQSDVTDVSVKLTTETAADPAHSQQISQNKPVEEQLDSDITSQDKHEQNRDVQIERLLVDDLNDITSVADVQSDDVFFKELNQDIIDTSAISISQPIVSSQDPGEVRTQSPEIDEYIDIPIIFCDKNGQPTCASPAFSVTSQNPPKQSSGDKVSKTKSVVDKRNVAERLAERLVAKRIKERQKTRVTGTLIEPVDQSTMCMRDLIYLNPQNSPMREDSPPREADFTKATETNDSPTHDVEVAIEQNMPIPQLLIGPNGDIIVNEASLVIHQKEPNFDDMEVVDYSKFRFEGYPKKPRSKRWGIRETKRFYAALSMVGTDFLLISKLIPHRTRDDIKKKFKREDKINRVLIDTALKEKRPIDISLLAEPVSDDDLTDERPPKKRKADGQKENKNADHQGGGPRKKAKTTKNSKKRVPTFYESSDESSTGLQTKVKSTKKKVTMEKRKVIEDEDESSTTEGNSAANADPYEFNSDTEVEEDIEITKIIQRRQNRAERTSKASEAPPQTSPEVCESSSPLQDKLSQQLQQMEMDQRRSEIKTGMEDLDNGSIPPSEGDDLVTECQKLFDRLPSNGNSRAVISIIDHRLVNLEELGIREIPPDHKLIVISTPLKENSFSQQTDDEAQQLLQVFTISESALESMMEDAKNSNFDPVSMLLAMAQGEGVDADGGAERVPPNDSANAVVPGDDEDSNATLENPSNLANSEDVALSVGQNCLSPPFIRDEPFIDDVKLSVDHDTTFTSTDEQPRDGDTQ